jgi:alkylation response protein AidB-like acyl-CoA dehydrogenase
MTTKIEELLAANAKLTREVLAANAADVDRERRFPRQNLIALGDAGILGLLVPAEYGGAGGGLAEMSAVLEQMAQGCASTAMIVMMHYCGTAVLVAKGSAKLKQEFLPAIARGKHITTLAFSEQGSGGHFYAPVSQLRANGNGFLLSAFKSFVTSGGEADSYVVSTRTSDAKGAQELDLFYVSKGTRGIELSGVFEGLGLAGNASGPMKFNDVALDAEIRIGEKGTGFGTMMEVVLPYFQIGSASVSMGIAASAFQWATAHVSARKYEHTGGTSLAQIPRIQLLVAEMALELRSARAYLGDTIRRAVSGDPEAMLDVIGVKARCTEACLAVVSRAMQAGGGAAYAKRGSLERIFRDAQAASVMSPTTDVLKDFLGKACLGIPLF